MCCYQTAVFGDLLCALVAIDFNIRTYENAQFLVWVPDYMVEFCKHVLPRATSVRSYTDAKTLYNETLPGTSTAWVGFHSPMRTHPVDYGFHVLSDRHIDDYNQKNYLKINSSKIKIFKYQLPEKYVVMACAATTPAKEMPVATMNQIIDYVISKGYTPVFLGKTVAETGVDNIQLKAKEFDINYSKGINLLNKTTLLDSAGIISNAKVMIGMDGGLIHLAGFTEVPIVVGYTFINPNHNVPIRHGQLGWNCFTVVPEESLACRFCQTNTNFIYDLDYRDCMLKTDKYKCSKQMLPDQFIKHLDNIL